MDENAMNGKVLWNGGKKPREHGSARLVRVEPRALMIAGAIVGAVLLIGSMVAPLCAQSYPNKPIRLILPFAQGGTTDVLGRIVAQKLAERLGQPVLPENRPGAGANIGTDLVAKAKPDGYTLLLASPTLAISPSLEKDLPYDPIKDLAPISLAGQIPFVVIVRSSFPHKSLKELVDYAKANPGKRNYGSSGIGSTNHLAFELLKSLAKINIVHVPYKGAGPMLIGLMSGEVDMGVVGPPTALSQIQAGKIRALAVLRNERILSLPNVPTAKEAGIDNFEVTTWFGILAPAGTPRDIVNRLNAEWIKTVAMPDTKEMMQKAGLEPLSSTPEQFAELIKRETIRWSKVIKEANLNIK